MHRFEALQQIKEAHESGAVIFGSLNSGEDTSISLIHHSWSYELITYGLVDGEDGLMWEVLSGTKKDSPEDMMREIFSMLEDTTIKLDDALARNAKLRNQNRL